MINGSQSRRQYKWNHRSVPGVDQDFFTTNAVAYVVAYKPPMLQRDSYMKLKHLLLIAWAKVCSFGMIWIKKSWCIKCFDKSNLGKDSSAPLMHDIPSDLESMILIQTVPNECILNYRSIKKLKQKRDSCDSRFNNPAQILDAVNKQKQKTTAN